MRTCNVVVERDEDSGLYVGWVPGAHAQGEDLDELRRYLGEVMALLNEGTSEEDYEIVFLPADHPSARGDG
jgi:predicted RNase H-like HicB family nuclease